MQTLFHFTHYAETGFKSCFSSRKENARDHLASSIFSLAEVLGRYSKLGPTGVRVAKAAESARQDQRSEPWASPEVIVRTLRRMAPEEIAAMVADYQAGIGSWRLARKYGVSDTTVVAHLKSAGVQLDPERKRTAREARTDEMRQLKEAGFTLTEIGRRYGVTRQAVAMRLKRQLDAGAGQ